MLLERSRLALCPLPEDLGRFRMDAIILSLLDSSPRRRRLGLTYSEKRSQQAAVCLQREVETW
jgi:hypothetical protein